MTHLCIDMGGSNIKMGLIDDGRVRLARSFTLTSAFDLRDLEDMAGAMLSSAEADVVIHHVGIAVPGIVDRRGSALLTAHGKYASLLGVDLVQWATERFGAPAAVENDARAALLGEVTYGVASGATDAVLLVLGTGIGTAAMMDGSLLRGSHGHAGILGGHLTVDLDAPPCPCGNVGCAESLASTWALDRALRADPEFVGSYWAHPAVRPDIKMLVDQAQAGERVAERVFNRFLSVWGATLVALCHAYDPMVVVVSGGVMNAAASILPPLEAYVASHLWTSSFRPLLVVPASPEYSVMRGLSVLAPGALPEGIHQ